MKLIKYPDRSQWNEILKRPILETENLFDTVRNIINRVRAGGDRVVMEYEAVFDKAELTSLAVTSAEIEEAEKEVPIELRQLFIWLNVILRHFILHSVLRGKRWTRWKVLLAGKKLLLLKRSDCISLEGQPLYSPLCLCWLYLLRLPDVKRLYFVHRLIRMERYILLSCLPLVWLESAKSLRLVEYRPLPLWLTGQRVFLKFIRSLVPAISMSPLPSNLSACGMSPLICLRGRRR